MAAGRTMITTTASLQRGDYGEQPLWATVTLAAMLGQIGLPGGGYTIAMAVNANIGNTGRLFRAGVVDHVACHAELFEALVRDHALQPNARTPPALALVDLGRALPLLRVATNSAPY